MCLTFACLLAARGGATRRLSEMQDYFVASGTQKQKSDMSRVVDHSYAEYAVARLGKM
ncbi:MAG: hypothetical protein ACHQ7M_00740 [Chloroflexota bacterium]